MVGCVSLVRLVVSVSPFFQTEETATSGPHYCVAFVQVLLLQNADSTQLHVLALPEALTTTYAVFGLDLSSATSSVEQQRDAAAAANPKKVFSNITGYDSGFLDLSPLETMHACPSHMISQTFSSKGKEPLASFF